MTAELDRLTTASSENEPRAVWVQNNHVCLRCATANGHQALAMCRTLKSPRTVERLRPLKNEADRRRGSADARELSHAIATQLAASATHHDPIHSN